MYRTVSDRCRIKDCLQNLLKSFSKSHLTIISYGVYAFNENYKN